MEIRDSQGSNLDKTAILNSLLDIEKRVRQHLLTENLSKTDKVQSNKLLKSISLMKEGLIEQKTDFVKIGKRFTDVLWTVYKLLNIHDHFNHDL